MTWDGRPPEEGRWWLINPFGARFPALYYDGVWHSDMWNDFAAPSYVKMYTLGPRCVPPDADDADMAIVGRNLMDAIEAVKGAENSPYADWSPADDPAEIVTDLFEDMQQAREKLRASELGHLARSDGEEIAAPAVPQDAREVVKQALAPLTHFHTFNANGPLADAAIAALVKLGWRKG